MRPPTGTDGMSRPYPSVPRGGLPMLPRMLTAGLGVVLAMPFALGAQPSAATVKTSTAEEIRKLVDALEAKDFKVREQATKRLIELGMPILPVLQEAIKGRSLEVTRRARHITEAAYQALEKYLDDAYEELAQQENDA